jgi:hypothetical protein
MLLAFFDMARGRLLKALLCVRLLIATTAVQAECQPYAYIEVGGEGYYPDPATIQPNWIGFALVVLRNFTVPIRESFGTFQSIISGIELDCKTISCEILAFSFTDNPWVKEGRDFRRWDLVDSNPDQPAV